LLACLICLTTGICLPRAMPGQAEAVGDGVPRTAGLALRGMRWDAVLRRSWAIYWDPVHPERPVVAIPVAGAAGAVEPAAGTGEPVAQITAAGARPQPVVHAGDRVLLWREDRNLRLQLTAVAEQSGAVGESIRVRIPGASWGGGMQADQPGRGRVRGAAEVEMEP
jgi:Chaperone for flagella basal body P-ring formation